VSDAAVLIFAKAPLPGAVKTRLIPALGEQGATRLYSRLLRRQFEWMARSTPYAMELWAAPDGSHPLFRELAERHRLSIFAQRGEDLGARMGHAAQEAFERHRRLLLLGIDCPALTPAHLRQAFRWLEQGADAVLGPAEDGGYVLLGLNRWHPALFSGHAWGSGSVTASTRQALRKLGWQWRELPQLWDLDRPDDLSRLTPLGIEL
jgi:uncharacterized protein